MKLHSASLVWFRDDLRLEDNPALHRAMGFGGPVIPVFIWAPHEEGDWPPGAASRWWLHFSLGALSQRLARADSRLIIRRGNSLEELGKLAQETGAKAVFWNDRYEPAALARDGKIKEVLGREGIQVESFNGKLLFEPWAVKNKSGGPFKVFTPFWRTCLATPAVGEPLPVPKKLAAPVKWPGSDQLEDLELLPKIDWASGIRASWKPGEAGATENLERFLSEAFEDYDEGRNRPDLRGTSRLSPHSHFGEISPRQVWQALRNRAKAKKLPERSWRGSQWVAELGWREFAHHLLYHFPHTPLKPLRPEFEKFRWRDEPDWLKAWQRGQTGYPVVDAGMRELWATGWMHNRVRMIVASFLVKDLLLPWQLGARWFWDTLVDADLANNTLGWQWTAGCGADAAPYFRIFNPTTQGEKFDPKGAYVRRWVPELARLPQRWIHRPHEAPPEVLSQSSVSMGSTYPKPIVPHGVARELALEAYARIRT